MSRADGLHNTRGALRSGRKRKKLNQPPMLFRRTQRLVNAIEAELGTTFLTYWNASGSDIVQSDVVGFNEILRRLGNNKRVALFIKSGGGSGRTSLRIVNLLRQHAGVITALVPLECASAATMMALGADEIHMGPLAYLSAIDTSITHDLSPIDKDNDRVSVSQNELTRITRLWRRESRGEKSNPYASLFSYIHPLVIGAVDRASSLSIRLCKAILSYHMTDKRAIAKIGRYLNEGYPAHTYPITLREARRIGLHVRPLKPSLNDALIELNKVYSEMGRRGITDYDDRNYHNSAISTIIESRNVQVFFQWEKDWHYRTEERRWVPLNDESSWHKIEQSGNKMRRSIFHIR